MKENLGSVSTADLVEELKRRPGVEVTLADPYEGFSISGTGPAVILVVED